ncbi:MAG: multiheme c-type cytochrome [bacterium]|nr:multiheme c-type cytochrome [bacterium]MDT8396731.1 multiheme c-type cytochrome [bacterium]
MKRATIILASALLLTTLMTGGGFAVDMEKFPFFPSLFNTKTGGPVSSTEFEDPGQCKICHGEIYKQWQGSMHSNSWLDPVFQALWKVGDDETDGAIRNLCAGCHSPIGTVAEEVVFDPDKGRFVAGPLAEKGVQCDFCHTVSESTWRDTPAAQPMNGSLIMDPGDVKRGPYRESDSPGHDTAYSELHTSAEFCGSCHHVFHPVTNFPIERTYDEWKQSVYAREGIVCQDCHMMPLEKAIEAARTMKKPVNPGKASPLGPDRDTVYTHEFVGGNFAVLALLGADKHAGIARERLKSAAELKIHLPEKAITGQLVRFKVEVVNVGAGHNLPTSLTEVRQMWLDVTVTDPGGNVLMRSGAVDDHGAIDPEANIFHTVAVDKEGNVTHKPWAISYFSEVRVIPPKGSDTSTYTFLMPGNLKKGELSITAVLRYRSFSQHLADLLLGEGKVQVPVVDMKTEQAALKISKK